MPSLKLTRRSVAAIEPLAAGPSYYWDTDLPGFGIVVRISGRSWLVQYRTDGGRRGATRRLVLGDATVLTPEVARAEAKRILARAAMGEDPAAERAAGRKAESVAEIVEAWIAGHIVPLRRASTAAWVRQVADVHILPHLGSMKAVSLTRADVLRFHAAVTAGRTARAKPGAKPRTTRERQIGGKTVANRGVTLLASALEWAIRNGILPAGTINPAARLQRHREQPRERFLDSAEMARLGEALTEAGTVGIEWAPPAAGKPGSKHLPKLASNRREVFDTHAVAAVRLLALTGLRKSEVLLLRWADVDFERGFLRLRQSKTGARPVPVSPAVLALLRGLDRIGSYVIAGPRAGTSEEAPRKDLKPIWRAVTRRADLEGTRLHDLRHSHASFTVSGGFNLPIVAVLLGHSNIATSKRYAHLSDDPVRAAADAVGAEIAGALGLPAAEVVSLADRRRA